MDHIDKLLGNISSKHRDQIIRAIACLNDATCRTNLRIQKLTGTQQLFYIHVGKYRVIFKMTGDIIRVHDARLRNEKTYRDI